MCIKPEEYLSVYQCCIYQTLRYMWACESTVHSNCFYISQTSSRREDVCRFSASCEQLERVNEWCVPSCPLFHRASISRDPFYDMLATRKRRIANKKWWLPTFNYTTTLVHCSATTSVTSGVSVCYEDYFLFRADSICISSLKKKCKFSVKVLQPITDWGSSKNELCAAMTGKNRRMRTTLLGTVHRIGITTNLCKVKQCLHWPLLDTKGITSTLLQSAVNMKPNIHPCHLACFLSSRKIPRCQTIFLHLHLIF